MDMNFLAKLKGLVSPTSTAGMLGNSDLYNTYVQQALESGSQPVGRMEFMKMLQANPQMAAQLQGQGGGQPPQGQPGTY